MQRAFFTTYVVFLLFLSFAISKKSRVNCNRLGYSIICRFASFANEGTNPIQIIIKRESRIFFQGFDSWSESRYNQDHKNALVSQFNLKWIDVTWWNSIFQNSCFKVTSKNWICVYWQLSLHLVCSKVILKQNVSAVFLFLHIWVVHSTVIWWQCSE